MPLPRIAGVYDALSAKILQKAGHKSGFISGAAVSGLHLALLSYTPPAASFESQLHDLTH